MTLFPRAALILVAVPLLAACASSRPPDLPPADIVRRSAERMTGMSGFHFLVERDGAPAFIDPQNTLSLRRAEGVFQAPDRVEATIRVIAPGMVAEVRVISIASIQWETNFISGEWEQLPPDWGFNPGVLFDPASGIQAALIQDLAGLTLAGVEELEELPGQPLYRIRGQMAGERIRQVSYGMIGPDPSDAELWIAPETFELHRLILLEPGAEEDTKWRIDFWDFDLAVEIVPPIGEGG